MQTIHLETQNNTPESHDALWMLAQMYCRFSIKKKASIISFLLSDAGNEIFICISHHITIPSSESGIHRVCKISPYDKKGRRYTNFVDVSINGNTSKEIVRSYIFDPIKYVKNIKNDKKTDKIEEVLAGNLKLLL